MPIYKTGKIKDGKQGYRVVVNYTDAHGNYQKKTQIAYGAPEAKRAEMILISKFSELISTSSMTFENLFDLYLQAKNGEIRETSLRKTLTVINNHVLPILGNVRLDKLEPNKLQLWKNEINQKNLATITKQKIYGEFRAVLNYAVKMDYMSKNPLDKIDNFRDVYFEKPQDKLKYYTPEQFKKYIAVAEELMSSRLDRACYVFFNIAYFTGMRKGEINALKWSDIEGDIIHVRRSVAQKIKGKPIVETPPKNKASYRDVQMPNRLKAVLDEHKAHQKSYAAFSEDWRVCGGPNCISDTSISNYNTKYADAAELPHIRIHDFRHSHASLLANEGINIQEIARRLGHSKIEMTWNTYAHLYPREEERALKILDKI